MWAEEAHFFCEAPRANSPNDPPIEPTKIFDNLYVIGNQGTVAYVIATSDGLLMIDSLAANQVDSQLLPGFQKLGLDPAKVKVIVMGHGHADHFGGSPYMQEHYGSKVYIAAADWDLMEHPPAGRGGEKKGPPPVLLAIVPTDDIWIVANFKEETKKAKVEVELQNHPLMDPIQAKLDKLKARKPGDPNPFVVGQANYQRFVDVISGCTEVNIARRKG